MTTTDTTAPSNGTATSQALAKQNNTPSALIEQYRNDFALVLPSHIKPDQWVRLSQGVMRRNKELARIAMANPGSFLSALLDCARLGLEPGDTYHLVAFGNEIVGIPDYTGLIELIYRTGAVSSVKAELVYENDKFRYDPGTMDRPEHSPDWFSGDRGKLIGVYAYALMTDGAVSRVVVMTIDEVERVRAVSRSSKSSSSPWVKWYDRMVLKTAIRQLVRWVPSSAEYRQQAMAALGAAEQVAAERNLPQPKTDDDLPDIPEAESDADIVDAEVVEDQTPALDDGDPGPSGPDFDDGF